MSVLRPMSLYVYKGLPAVVITFGSSDDNKNPFYCHLDSYAVMNTCNLLLHMWIITTYPAMLLSCEQYDDVSPFQPITLDYAISAYEAEKNTGKLSDIVTYKTRYNDKEGNMLILSFGLEESVTVNAILILPTFRD